jgi:hypothetical protein
MNIQEFVKFQLNYLKDLKRDNFLTDSDFKEAASAILNHSIPRCYDTHLKILPKNVIKARPKVSAE